MAAAARENPVSARGPRRDLLLPRAQIAPSHASQNFLKFVERSKEAFMVQDTSDVLEVQQTLLQVRQQYDCIHHEAEQKEAKLKMLKEEIRAVDLLHGQRAADHTHHLDTAFASLERQHEDTLAQIKETLTSRKVYEHMLARIQREHAILKQKMLLMEEHLGRKRREVQRKRTESERTRLLHVDKQKQSSIIEHDDEAEEQACQTAKEFFDDELKRRKDAMIARENFEKWRKEKAKEAANEAFNASSGRLRKIYAIEKLAGNHLQKITFEQVERSQNTEDDFQKIRDVTGLADVMDIVHKFLDRDVEHDQLKQSVKDAEGCLELLLKEYEACKKEASAIPSLEGGGDFALYKDIEKTEQVLVQVNEDHEAKRLKLQSASLQAEHVKRWATRVGQLLESYFDSPVKVDDLKDLKSFFHSLGGALEKFFRRVQERIREKEINKRAIADFVKKEYQEQSKVLSSREYLAKNCRVPALTDLSEPKKEGRPTSRQGKEGDDDPAMHLAEERARLKKDSEERQSKIGRASARPAAAVSPRKGGKSDERHADGHVSTSRQGPTGSALDLEQSTHLMKQAFGGRLNTRGAIVKQ